MPSPYENLDARQYWKSAVATAGGLDGIGLYRKKYAIGAEDKIATAGSCFAQHIARNLKSRGYQVLDVEPAPPGLPDPARYGYGIYSARYGNVYTARQMLQLVQECLGTFKPEAEIWERDGRFFDALRPSVEPHGLQSPEAVREHRANHLGHVRSLLQTTDVFVFTLGLTESWEHRASGTVFPTAPGTMAGTYDPDVFSFRNFRSGEVYRDLLGLREILRSVRPRMRLLLTVSPVPLTATAADAHALVATSYSKSALRAAAGEISDQFDDVDYFPSFEIISNPFFGNDFFEENRRSVKSEGVDQVMRIFFAEHGAHEPAASPKRQVRRDVVCEDALLEAFA